MDRTRKRAETATERAYAYTKQRILDSRFAGGELLSEGEVAEVVGMSRTPVREAFLRLEAEGLLRLYPRRGALVVPVSALEVETVMETRLLLERFAIEKIVRLQVPIVAELEHAIARQERLVGRKDARGFVEADRAFHRIFVAGAGNPIVTDLYDSLRDRQSRMGLVAITHHAERSREILDEHRALSRAIDRRDEADALRVLEDHLRGTFELLRGGAAALRVA
jgi:DNA-binding GntR family transcriptional regulator